MNLELKDKVVLITGGTGGIGKQIVADFLEEGAIVACFIRNNSKMNVLRNELASNNVSDEKLFSYECNLMDFEDVKSSCKTLFSQLKSIDVLVNCAGIVHEYPFAIIDQKQMDEMIDLNLKSPIYLAQAVLKYMYKQKVGNIINISSVSSIKKGRGIAVYAAAKAGLDSFTRTLAMEVGRKNIRVNSIRPGVIKTNMSEGLMERIEGLVKDSTSLNRAGNTNEISKMVLCLASNKISSYITGESINIDGGLY